ncbi:MAG TPA: hypothetical protein VMS14_08140 [Ilumatobacteraceae bacterium]|nr:hypothetical protein [Ilumatobacteraceae bacterium]
MVVAATVDGSDTVVDVGSFVVLFVVSFAGSVETVVAAPSPDEPLQATSVRATTIAAAALIPRGA